MCQGFAGEGLVDLGLPWHLPLRPGLMSSRAVRVSRLLSASQPSRGSRELVYQDSKACQAFPASPAHPGRRGTSGDRASRESTVLSAPQAFRDSEVTF